MGTFFFSNLDEGISWCWWGHCCIWGLSFVISISSQWCPFPWLFRERKPFADNEWQLVVKMKQTGKWLPARTKPTASTMSVDWRVQSSIQFVVHCISFFVVPSKTLLVLHSTPCLAPWSRALCSALLAEQFGNSNLSSCLIKNGVSAVDERFESLLELSSHFELKPHGLQQSMHLVLLHHCHCCWLTLIQRKVSTPCAFLWHGAIAKGFVNWFLNHANFESWHRWMSHKLKLMLNWLLSILPIKSELVSLKLVIKLQTMTLQIAAFVLKICCHCQQLNDGVGLQHSLPANFLAQNYGCVIEQCSRPAVITVIRYLSIFLYVRLCAGASTVPMSAT